MNETSQAIVVVKREVRLAVWRRQMQERQEQGVTVDEWCINLGITNEHIKESLPYAGNGTEK